MYPFQFYATDEKEKTYPFRVEEKEDRLCLTLPKEEIAHVKKLWALADFTRAAAGEEGYYLQPRNIGMMGEFQTFFTEREDLVYSNENTIGLLHRTMLDNGSSSKSPLYAQRESEGKVKMHTLIDRFLE